MLNLIKMDLRRLVHMKSFWIMIALTVTLSAFGVYLTDYALNLQNDVSMQSGVLVIDMDAMTDEVNKIAFTELLNTDIAGWNLALLCAIFVPIFVNGEQKNGYIKNIAGQIPNRGMLMVSKLAAAAVQVAVIFAAYAGSMAVAGKVFWGEKLVLDSVAEFAKMVGIEYLLHIGFASFVIALTILFRGSGLSITLGVLCATPMTANAYSLVSILLHKCGVPEDFSIGTYAIETCIASVNAGLSGTDLTRVIVVGIAYIAICTLTSMIVLRKRDV